MARDPGASSSDAGAFEPDFGSRTDFYTFSPESLGKDLPDYEILGEVGKGSMGLVYEARRRKDGLRVALKILPPSLTLTERTLARFLREGNITSRMQHPAITRVYDQGRQGRLHYFAMEFVDGITLDERLELGPLPARQVAEIGARAADALHYAHEQGIVHRDVKPGNVMLRPDGTIAMTDFGLARDAGSGSMTESGAIVGTPMYMAPEQVHGGGAGENPALGDIYGLGATLYTAATGEAPFEGPTAQAVLKAVLERDPPPPRRRRRDLPRDLENVIVKAMEKDPARRYGSALEMAEDLERFVGGERVLARRPSLLDIGLRKAAQRPLLTAMVAVILLLSAGAVYLDQQRRQRRVEADLAAAEVLLAEASTRTDEQGRVLSRGERERTLHQAAAKASAVLTQAPEYWRAWFVRAKANLRLTRFDLALHDLDRAAELRGEPDAAILHFRIDTLRMLEGRTSRKRLREDLATLLENFDGEHTRCLVAEHLLGIASDLRSTARAECLDSVDRVLEGIQDQELPRAMAARARSLELRGRTEDALALMRDAATLSRSDVVVQSAAAAMFERLGLFEEGQAARDLVRALDEGHVTPPSEAQGIDSNGVQSFVDQLNGLLKDLGGNEE